MWQDLDKVISEIIYGRKKNLLTTFFNLEMPLYFYFSKKYFHYE